MVYKAKESGVDMEKRLVEWGEEVPEVEGVIKGGEGVINALNVCVGLSSIFNFLKNRKFEKIT